MPDVQAISRRPEPMPGPPVLPYVDPVPPELEDREAIIACEGACKSRPDRPQGVQGLFTLHVFLRRERGALAAMVLRGREACVRHLYRCRGCGAVRVYGCE